MSDDEAKARADFDLRWKVALGIGLDERPFAKSTLQLFRAQLVIHEQVGAIFRRSLATMRSARAGLYTPRDMIGGYAGPVSAGAVARESSPRPASPPRLLDRVRDAVRTRHSVVVPTIGRFT